MHTHKYIAYPDLTRTGHSFVSVTNYYANLLISNDTFAYTHSTPVFCAKALDSFTLITHDYDGDL